MDYRTLVLELKDILLFQNRHFATLYSYSSKAGEDSLLLYLYLYHAPASPDELSEKLGLTSGRISNLLKALEQRGYILRTLQASDRRRVQISLTPAGRAHIEPLHQAKVDQLAATLAQLGEKDAKEYVRLQKKLFAIVSQES